MIENAIFYFNEGKQISYANQYNTINTHAVMVNKEITKNVATGRKKY